MLRQKGQWHESGSNSTNNPATGSRALQGGSTKPANKNLGGKRRHWRGQAWRRVKAQQVAATMKRVDDRMKQGLLEQLIETSKPAVPPTKTRCTTESKRLSVIRRRPVDRVSGPRTTQAFSTVPNWGTGAGGWCKIPMI